MCVNRTLYGICAAKHGRGDTENSYVFIFFIFFVVGSKRPRGWVSFTGNAPSAQATLAEVRELSG